MNNDWICLISSAFAKNHALNGCLLPFSSIVSTDENRDDGAKIMNELARVFLMYKDKTNFGTKAPT